MSAPPHRIALVVLAAGQSRRFGVADKLLAAIDGQPLIARTLAELVGTAGAPIAQIAQVLVVVPPGSAALQAAIGQVRLSVPAQIVENHMAATGMASSIACALAHLGDDITGAAMTAADMPSLTRAHIAKLVTAYVATEGGAPVHAAFSDGTPTNPMIWPRRCFAALSALTGDVGGRALLGAFAAISVPLGDDGGLADIDTPADLTAWQDRFVRK